MIHSLRVVCEFHVDLSHFLGIDIRQEVCLVIAFRGRRGGGGRDASDFFARVALAFVLFLLLRLLIFMLIITLQ